MQTHRLFVRNRHSKAIFRVLAANILRCAECPIDRTTEYERKSKPRHGNNDVPNATKSAKLATEVLCLVVLCWRHTIEWKNTIFPFDSFAVIIIFLTLIDDDTTQQDMTGGKNVAPRTRNAKPDCAGRVGEHVRIETWFENMNRWLRTERCLCAQKHLVELHIMVFVFG